MKLNMSIWDLLVGFDEQQRYISDILSDPEEGVFIEWVKRWQTDLMNHLETKEEVEKVGLEIQALSQECSVKERVVQKTRQLVDKERAMRIAAEKERDNLQQTLNFIRNHIQKDNLKPQNEEMRTSLLQLPYLSKQRRSKFMGRNHSAISEVDSTSLTISRDNLSFLDSDDENMSCTRSGKRFKKSSGEDVLASKPSMEKKSTEIIGSSNRSVVATTEVIIPAGPIEARAVIDAVKSPPRRRSRSEPIQHETDSSDSSASFSRKRTRAGTVIYSPKPYSTPILEGTPNRLYPQLPKANSVKQLRNRQHTFVSKSMLRPEHCKACNQRLRFGKQILKCMDCRTVCHIACKDDVPLPCVPASATPTQKMNKRKCVIADYAPSCQPAIPALVVHCIEEIEKRGLREEGLYRKSDSKETVKHLKHEFLKGKGVPNLSNVPVHAICGLLKSFLMDLDDPLIPNSSWKNFADAASRESSTEREAYFTFEVNDMARPNRDTLAYLMLHLNRVSKSPLCRMSKENLASVLGPTILGYSVKNPESHVIFSETAIQKTVLTRMLELEEDFWNDVINRYDAGKVNTPF